MQRNSLTHVSLILTVASILCQAEDWPQFRGPRGDGTSLATNLPLAWSETTNIVWKTRIPGRGRSSPVVLGNRVFVTTALEQNIRRIRIGPDDMQTATHVTLKAVCVDRADGKILWETLLFEVENPDPVHWLNSWATPTPVIEPGRFYCDFGRSAPRAWTMQPARSFGSVACHSIIKSGQEAPSCSTATCS